MLEQEREQVRIVVEDAGAWHRHGGKIGGRTGQRASRESSLTIGGDAAGQHPDTGAIGFHGPGGSLAFACRCLACRALVCRALVAQQLDDRS